MENKIIETIKKYFNIKIEQIIYDNEEQTSFITIQAKQDEGRWDTTACADIITKEDYEILKELENYGNNNK